MERGRLQTYRAKRDFSRTAEPVGKPRRAKGGRSFVVQKHAARQEHYDFRLEHDGVLLSWAVPKGPSADPADKRLAVHVEDHPLEYGGFEGTIPPGEYGAGTVMVWDRGRWQPHGDVQESLQNGKLSFTLHGKRLKGGWALVQLRSRGQDRRDNWLLIKEQDADAKSNGAALIERARTSAKTGRSMEEIARGSGVWRSNRGKAAAEPDKKTSRKTKTLKSATAGAKKKSEAGSATVPPFVAPQLATLVDEPPSGGDWLHEIKFDGYRILASCAGDAVRLWTRNGLDWTDKFPTLIGPLTRLRCRSALLDGEIAVADAEGHTDFGALQKALSEGTGAFGYYLFDLLHLDGRDWRSRPLIERKERLESLLQRAPKKGPLFYSSHVLGRGQDVFRNACDLTLEGIICKRTSEPYRSGRSRSWLKVKCAMEQEFVIIGWQPSEKPARPFSSLLLGVREGKAWRYCGRIGTGFSERVLKDLAAHMRKLERRDPAARDTPRAVRRTAHFVDPVLVAEVAFRGWTRDGLVRQGSFKGLRADKPARTVVRERPINTQAIG